MTASIAGFLAASPRVSLPEQVDLSGLVILTANTLEIPLEFDPAILKPSGSGASSTVTLRGVSDVTPDELWALTNQVLASRQLALVRSPNAHVLSIVKLADAPNASGVQIATVQPDTSLRPGFVQQIIRPKFRSAKDLAEAIKPFLTKNVGTATPVGDSGLLLISDLASRVEEAKKLLDTLDVPREDISPLVVEARNIPATALQSAVTQLAAKRDAVSGDKLRGELTIAPDGKSLLLVAPAETRDSWLKLIAALDQREEVITRDYTPKVFSAKEVANLIEQTIREKTMNAPAAAPSAQSADDRLRVVTDELTGTLIVTATPTQHERIVALLARLDATPQSAARPVRAFPVRNRPVKEVLQTLQSLIAAGALDTSSVVDASGQGAAAASIRDAGAQRTSRSDDPSQGSVIPVGCLPTARGSETLLESAGPDRRMVHAHHQQTGTRRAAPAFSKARQTLGPDHQRRQGRPGERLLRTPIRRPECRVRAAALSPEEGLQPPARLRRPQAADSSTASRMGRSNPSTGRGGRARFRNDIPSQRQPSGRNALVLSRHGRWPTSLGRPDAHDAPPGHRADRVPPRRRRDHRAVRPHARRHLLLQGRSQAAYAQVDGFRIAGAASGLHRLQAHRSRRTPWLA
ncbi:MAG: hypothetical protein KF691_04120 [Phycisphaeraceae bacterium]|nr:hypothetical protein [Phycisphaeraceae bacterium]